MEKPTVKVLQIVDSINPTMWYANLIGKCVPFVRDDGVTYWSREPEGFINIVEKTDAILIEVTEDGPVVIIS